MGRILTLPSERGCVGDQPQLGVDTAPLSNSYAVLAFHVAGTGSAARDTVALRGTGIFKAVSGCACYFGALAERILDCLNLNAKRYSIEHN